MSNEGLEPEDIRDLLTRQEETGPDDFIRNLRRRIHRRSIAAQVATFTWELPQAVLVELLHLSKEVFAAVGSRKENEP
jgi:hypothetical protein